MATHHPIPSMLRANSRWERLGGEASIPVMLVHPDDWERPVPLVLWMHGRTVHKEIDPGRYLRLMRAGVGVCAVDLPGHGERHQDTLQHPARTLDVVTQMVEEIDVLLEDLGQWSCFDRGRLAIGGMSAGGMATFVRLCRPHSFLCAAVEATSGSWVHQQHRRMFEGRTAAEIDRLNPMTNLDQWREIPLLALHARHDAWVALEGQIAFLDALRERYADPSLIELVTFDHTGAPDEHAGFGRYAANAKNRQRDFFVARLLAGAPT